MNLIKQSLIKKLGIKVKDDNSYKHLEESIKILQTRSKEFFIEV